MTSRNTKAEPIRRKLKRKEPQNNTEAMNGKRKKRYPYRAYIGASKAHQKQT